MISIPLKIGNEDYYTIEKNIVTDLSGKAIAKCSMAPSIKVDQANDMFCANKTSCRDIDIYQLIEIFNRAADIFKGNVLMGNEVLSFDDYINIVVESTGLPVSYVKEGQAVIYYYFKNIGNILKAQSPNMSLDVYNEHMYMKGNKTIGWIKDGIDVGVISPSNNSTVHTVWMMALAMKSQIMIKPSLNEVFTPLRIIQSLLDAGLPKEFVCFLPGNHKITNKILSTTSKGILFGSSDVIDRYKKGFPNVKYYGPGSSKLFVDEDSGVDFDKVVTHAIDGIMSYGGKGCISISSIICTKDGRKYSDSIAEKLSHTHIYNPLDTKAIIPAVKETNLCTALNKYIQIMVDLGAENMSQKYIGSDPYVVSENCNYLLPTVLYMEPTHPMFGIELPFPFVTVTSASGSLAKNLLRKSLAVSIISGDNEIYQELLQDESIQVLHRGLLENVYDVDPEKPFEGFMSDYLFKVKTI
ncbi:aldehyde dehydrogenase family protein [Vallitalea guaymasensis]|uniref:aldehyde dehydrogenase family protein n=1 Tax=Vallitalea guaymasensis TaxID=1185412 RepID=UPI002353ECD5|nr:aldehyde dehydrogenase family protein [Vallitalea guaymasensis]